MKQLIHWRDFAMETPEIPDAVCLVGFPDAPLVLSAVWREQGQVFVMTSNGASCLPAWWAYADPRRSDLEMVSMVFGSPTEGDPNVRN